MPKRTLGRETRRGSDGDTRKSAITRAIESTISTIEGRARLYRNLVVSVAVVSLGCLLLSLLLRRWFPVLGLVSLIPLCASFVTLDQRLVRRWQGYVLDPWRNGELRLQSLEVAVASMRQIPLKTFEGMMWSVYRYGDVSRVDQLSEQEKSTLVVRLKSDGWRDMCRLWCGTAAATATVTSLLYLIRHPTLLVALCLVGSMLIWATCRIAWRSPAAS